MFEDPKPHPALITLFMAWLKKCQAYGVIVHIIMGNHDVFRTGFIYTSPLDIISEADMDGVNIYKEINTIIIGTSAFTFMPYRDRKAFSAATNDDAIAILRDSLVYELASIPSTYRKVVIGHQALEGSIPIGDEIDDLTNELFCPLDMFNGYDYVWMGHVHKPQVMQRKPHIAHIGSMDISNFGETDHKKHIIVFNCAEENGWFIENLPTRSLQKITISVPKDRRQIRPLMCWSRLEKAGVQDKAIVRVEVALTSPELKSINKTAIDKYLTSNGAFNVNGISSVQKSKSYQKRR